MPSLVREDRDGGAYGEPAVAPAARPGSRAPRGEALNASKREAAPKMRPDGPAGEHGVDRAQAQAARAVQPSATNRPDYTHPMLACGARLISALYLIIPQELCLKCPGGHGPRETPVPIPNTEAKTRAAEGTAPKWRGREGSCRGLFLTYANRKLLLSFFNALQRHKIPLVRRA